LEAISDAEADVFVSAASAWEIAIKKQLGKLDAPDDLPEQLARHRFAALPVTIEHALAVGELPLHHRDPFDRMLVAQARLGNLTIVTDDPRIRGYGVACVEAS
jgi:PIN domain nuclease of toxin-antitoxin system